MSDDFDLDAAEYSLDDDDVTLDPDQKNAGSPKQEWLKFTQKNQLVRGAFVYFYTVDSNAAQKAMKEGVKAGKKLSREEVAAVAKGALAKRAQDLSKAVDELSPIERLDLTVAHFKSLRAHYHADVGYVISRMNKDGAEADALWKRLGDVKSYFTTLLLVYPTDVEGTLNKEAFGEQIKANKLKLVPWRFSNKTYDVIYGVNEGLRENSLSLASQDVKIECDNPKYQGVKVTTAGPTTWQKNQLVKTAVLTAALNMYDKLNPFRELTTDQLREKLGVSGGSSSSFADDASSENFSEVLQGV